MKKSSGYMDSSTSISFGFFLLPLQRLRDALAELVHGRAAPRGNTRSSRAATQAFGEPEAGGWSPDAAVVLQQTRVMSQFHADDLKLHLVVCTTIRCCCQGGDSHLGVSRIMRLAVVAMASGMVRDALSGAGAGLSGLPLCCPYHPRVPVCGSECTGLRQV